MFLKFSACEGLSYSSWNTLSPVLHSCFFKAWYFAAMRPDILYRLSYGKRLDTFLSSDWTLNIFCHLTRLDDFLSRDQKLDTFLSLVQSMYFVLFHLSKLFVLFCHMIRH
jgi:hypothetical protein